MTTIEAITQLNLVLGMERANLVDIPSYPLPFGYTLHWYEPGDGEHWFIVQRAAEAYLLITPELFQEQYGDDIDLLHQRLFFLRAPSGETIATTAAWFDGDPAGPMGLIHWVAIKPAFQGLGLANSLMTIACERLRQLGHDRARLTTSSARIAAINLYLKFGFQPANFARTGQDLWHELRKHLKESVVEIERLGDFDKLNHPITQSLSPGSETTPMDCRMGLRPGFVGRLALR